MDCSVLLIAALAVFWGWETILSLSPWSIPPIIQPVIVFVAAFALVSPQWQMAAAVSGAVALLHSLVRTSSAPEPQAIRLPLRNRVPRIP